VDVQAGSHTLKVHGADHNEATTLLLVLIEDKETSSRTLGKIDYDYDYSRIKSLFEEAGKVTKRH
jgi:hypothetical protein